MTEPVVRFARVDAEVARHPVSIAQLAPWERARRDRLRLEADRNAFVAAHLLARDCVAELTGEKLELSARCPSCGAADHGRPFVAGRADVFVSLSHTAGWVAAIAAFDPCGIDVQTIAPVPDLALTTRERSVAKDDRARSVLWARKEAMMKAGDPSVGSLDDFGRFDISEPDDRIHDWALQDAVGASIVLPRQQPRTRIAASENQARAASRVAGADER